MWIRKASLAALALTLVAAPMWAQAPAPTITLSTFSVVFSATITNAVAGQTVSIVCVAPDGTSMTTSGLIPAKSADLNWSGTTYKFQSALTGLPPGTTATFNVLDSTGAALSAKSIKIP